MTKKYKIYKLENDPIGQVEKTSTGAWHIYFSNKSGFSIYGIKKILEEYGLEYKEVKQNENK